MAVTFEGFNLQDANYIISDIQYRSSPSRILEAQKRARHPGVHYTETEFAEKKIGIQGSILGSSATDLQSKIDGLYKGVVRQQSGTLSIESGRTISAIVSDVQIEDAHYNQTYVPFSLEFTALEPFYSAEAVTVTLTIVSGTTSRTDTLTISGSAPAEPTVTYTAPTGSGSTTVSGVRITYVSTAQTATWSGYAGVSELSYSDYLTFDWGTQFISRNGTKEQPSGTFPLWEPGDRQITTTFSGTAPGGTLVFSYSPRFI